jgi:ATP-binding cassette, sub-family E, member 1
VQSDSRDEKATMPPKKAAGKAKGGDDDNLTRIAIVNTSKCKPKKCNQECKKSCPVVRLGKLCIEVGPKSKLAFISEPLCIGRSGGVHVGCDARPIID